MINLVVVRIGNFETAEFSRLTAERLIRSTVERKPEELAIYTNQDSMCQAVATHCLMELAEADTASVLDAVPALEAR